MVYPKNGWLVVGIQSVIVAFIVTLIAMGCALPPVSKDTSAESMVQTIGDIWVSREGDDSVIRLAGLADPIYSVSTSDDQMLIAIDMVGVSGPSSTDQVGAVADRAKQIAAYDGVVDLVTLSTFYDEGGVLLTRVEVAMAGPGHSEVVPTSDGLEIWIIPGLPNMDSEGDDVPMDSAAAFEPINGEDPGLSDLWGEADGDSFGTLDEAVASSTAAPPAATQLTGVTATVTEGGVLVRLSADGEIESVQAFTLQDPTRLVVDLPGLTLSGVAAKIRVDSEHVVAVRTGSHADKVRVVLDGGSEANGFQGRQTMPGVTGLWLAIGEGEELEQALNDSLAEAELAWLGSTRSTTTDSAPAQEAIEEITEAATEDSPMRSEGWDFEVAETLPEAVEIIPSSEDLSQVYGLRYERSNGVDRTAILTDEAVIYTTSAPDATTLVVLIPGATISQQASDRIFPKAGGPVSLIHAFQQPDVETPEVRVVFTRAPNQAPVLTRRGSMIFVDFEDLGVAAAPPPAFPNAGEADAMAESSAQPPAQPFAPTPSGDMAMMEPGAGDTPTVPATLPQGIDMLGGTAETAMAGVENEVVAGLPSFESGPLFDAGPAALGNEDDVWAAPGLPAAVEVPAAIEVLEEGGLIDGKEYRGRRVSLDFKQVEIADVLRLIAEVSDLNIIAGDEVDGKVTIRLVDTPWDQALDVILMTKGLGFVRVGNVLRIAPSEVLKAEEEVRLQERRNKERLEDLEVKLLPVNYAKVKDTEGLVKRLLSARGTVNLDERTNTLIIKDISSVIDEASALIAAIDTQTPQVMIEAKIVEANLDFSRELGAVWAIQTQAFVDPFDPVDPRRDLGSEDLSFIDSNGLFFANPISSVANGFANFGALILDQDFRVDAQIQAAESTGDGKVVSSPRVVTLDNKEASIEQGVSIPFQTFEGGDAKLEFIDAVLSLVVTPHITADQSIIMEIEVTRNAPDDTVATPTGSPAIAKNVITTETLVKDGQTLVLGGIYTITKSKRQSRIPYLHRIPVIGNAFKSNSITDARKELLVFVTPRIVRLPEMSEN
jgi:type IV pilus assembly protein PilQ